MRRVLAVAVAALVWPSLTGAQPGAGDQVKRGESLYAANCLSCHGVAGKGITTHDRPSGALDVKGLGPSLVGVGALSADFYLSTGYMPLGSPHQQPRHKRLQFDREQIDALVAYVASLGTGPGIPSPHPERGDVAAGFQLFTEHCAGCHQVAAQGGYVPNAVAPPLHDVNAVQIAEAVRVGPYLMPSFSPKQISDRQLDSLIAYVLESKHPDDRGGWSIGRIGPVPEGLVAWLIGALALVACCVVIGRRSRA
jgi:ubiquinol-cytochrome c reductase cytochrome c subunit